MNGKVEDKLKAVTQAVRDLDKAHAQLGRIAIRNARRSLWARINAMKEECDAQYVLPPKEKPKSHFTLRGMAQRMTAVGFDSNFPWYAIEWPTDPVSEGALAPQFRGAASIAKADPKVLGDWILKLSHIAVNSCAHFGVPPCSLDATQISALNLEGSGRLGLRGITQPGFLRQLSKWILFQQGELKIRKKRRKLTRGKRAGQLGKPKPTETTKDGTFDVNLMMIEIAKLNGLLTEEQINADVGARAEAAA